MQEDKPPVFDAADSLMLCLTAMAGMLRDLAPDRARMREAAGAGYTTATDLADWLVRALGLPFREAHRATGELVRMAEERGYGLEDLDLESMQTVVPDITADIYDVLGIENSLRSRTSYGGTAPARVREQVARWRAALAGDAPSEGESA
jgi:argininosuccinate lyase